MSKVSDFKDQVTYYKNKLENFKAHNPSINQNTPNQINRLIELMDIALDTDFHDDDDYNFLNYNNNFTVVEAAVDIFITSSGQDDRLTLDNAINYMSATSIGYNPDFTEAIEYIDSTQQNSNNNTYNSYGTDGSSGAYYLTNIRYDNPNVFNELSASKTYLTEKKDSESIIYLDLISIDFSFFSFF